MKNLIERINESTFGLNQDEIECLIEILWEIKHKPELMSDISSLDDDKINDTFNKLVSKLAYWARK